MNTHTWSFLSRIDLAIGVTIVINVKGRDANLTIGQTPDGSQDVRRYIRPLDNEQIADLAAGLKMANERITEHQTAWDAKRAARKPDPRKSPGGKPAAKPMLGLKALAKQDAAKIGPEAANEVERKQREAAEAQRNKGGRSEIDREIRSRMKGSQGAKPNKGGAK